MPQCKNHENESWMRRWNVTTQIKGIWRKSKLACFSNCLVTENIANVSMCVCCHPCHPSPARCSLWPCTSPHLSSPPGSSRSAGTPHPPGPDPTPRHRSPGAPSRGLAGWEPVCVCVMKGEGGEMVWENSRLVSLRLPVWEHSARVVSEWAALPLPRHAWDCLLDVACAIN